jgi:hypothetical protein
VTEVHKGSCFCGAIAFEARGAPHDMGYCHCGDCRAYSGAPVAGWSLWPVCTVRVTQGEDRLGGYNRTGFSNRRFCSDCGGAVFIQHPTLGLVDIPAGKLPSLAFAPSAHLNYASTRHPMADGLPKLRDFPAEIGGSGDLMAE